MLAPKWKLLYFAFLCVAAPLHISKCAHAEITIAIATPTPPDATFEDKVLLSGLLPLLEHSIGNQDGLQVVEREQAAVLVAEMVRGLESNDAAPLKTGQMQEANLLVSVELSPSDEPAKSRFAVIRVTEGATSVVRGVTAVPISAAQIEEATAEIADYVATIAEGPSTQTATIAILPFESVERFDRLRPLERGLRDLFVANFLSLDSCRVVQRSSMEQLLTELDFVRAGFTAGGRGLEGAPEREATYVLRGEIDERPSPDGNLVVIVAELVEVKSRKVVLPSERAFPPQEIAEQVAEIAAGVSRFVSAGDEQPAMPKKSAVKEIDRLYELAIRDVFRLNRNEPEDAGYSPFEIPGVQGPSYVLPSVEPESPLGIHLLKKSIDRLESVLFFEPERLTVALPLAYCLSFHIDGIWSPERCEELVRRIRSETTNDEMFEVSNKLLADMYFTHEGCLYSEREIAQVDPQLLRLAFDRRLEAFAAPSQGDLGDSRMSMLDLLQKICLYTKDQQQWSRLLGALGEVMEALAKQKMNPKSQNYLWRKASGFVASIVRNKKASAQAQREAEELLEQWRDSDVHWQHLYGKRRLLELHPSIESQQELDALLKECYADDTDFSMQQSQIMEKTQLARNLLYLGKAVEALHILEGIQLPNKSQSIESDLTNNQYGYYLGRCYESLGRKREAIQTYLQYAGMPPGHFNGLDFSKQIELLGGVPLDKDRDIAVQYQDLSSEEPFYCQAVATDGKRLFCSGGFQQGRRGPQAVPFKSVRQLDIDTGAWTNLGGPDDRVSCLAVGDGYLWAGTDDHGLWRRSLKTGEWNKWTTDDGLPTNSIISVETHGLIAYASVANINANRRMVSGGLTRIDPKAEAPIHIYRDEEAPQVAPGSMAIYKGELIVRDNGFKLLSLDLSTQEWRKLGRKASPIIAAGPSGLWYVPLDQIAALLDADEAAKKYPLGSLMLINPGSIYWRYQPRAFVEQDGQLWIAGPTRRRFDHSGLSRLDLATGELSLYGPREGFRYDDQNQYECFDAVWAQGRLWIATSFGLAEVTLRKSKVAPVLKGGQK